MTTRPDTTFGWHLSDAWVLTGRSLRLGVRQIDALIMGIALPVILLLVFVNIFGGAIEVGTEYLNYVVPGIILLTAGFGTSQVAVNVAHDLTTSTIDRLRSMPLASASLFVGHTTASMIRNLVSTVLVVSVAMLMGFRPTGSIGSILGAVGAATLYIMAIAWVSALLGAVATSPEGASGFTFFMLFLPYVSSAFVPVETLPDWIRGFATHQPVTHVIETIRSLLMGTPVGDSGWLAVGWSLGIIAISVPTVAVLYRRRTAL